MKITNKTLMPIDLGGDGLVDGLIDLSKKDLPVKISSVIRKMLKFSIDEFKDVFQHRKDILEKNSIKNDDGTPKMIEGGYVMVSPESGKKEIDELYGIEFDFEFKKIKLSELGLDKISPDLLSRLDPVLEE